MTTAPVIISDYAGHAFTVELARTLRERRHDVVYTYCRSVVTPKGRFDDQTGWIVPVSAGHRFEKYHLGRRLLSELRYGVNTGRVLWHRRPATHVVCNMPLVSLIVMWVVGLIRRIRLVVWFQDAQAGIVAGLRGGGIVARVLAALEGFVLRRASVVIAISEAHAEEARRHRVPPNRVMIVENWAPIEALPVRPKANRWAVAHGLHRHAVFLYSGTLARKHRADLLVSLARRVRDNGAIVVVVSEGEGADLLTAWKSSSPDLDNLRVLSYQPFEDLPDVLATGDVLVVLLEPNAGRWSVPSKTLSYLCAGRPILAAMPADNAAARLVTERAHAGLVVEPHDEEGFCAAAEKVLAEPEIWAAAGTRGREFAEQHFARDLIADRFERVLGLDAASTAVEEVPE